SCPDSRARHPCLACRDPRPPGRGSSAALTAMLRWLAVRSCEAADPANLSLLLSTLARVSPYGTRTSKRSGLGAGRWLAGIRAGRPARRQAAARTALGGAQGADVRAGNRFPPAQLLDRRSAGRLPLLRRPPPAASMARAAVAVA